LSKYFISDYTGSAVEYIKALLKQQHRELEDLMSEVQRKEVTPARVIRLMKIVRRNVELTERVVAILERMDAAKDLNEVPLRESSPSELK
jgi:hypothetical protein